MSIRQCANPDCNRRFRAKTKRQTQYCSAKCRAHVYYLAHSSKRTRRTISNKLSLHPSGYLVRYMPDHPSAWASGYIFEHIKVWTETNGPVSKGYIVHHKNGVKTDNRLENLELLTRARHSQKIEMACPHCGKKPSDAK